MIRNLLIKLTTNYKYRNKLKSIDTVLKEYVPKYAKLSYKIRSYINFKIYQSKNNELDRKDIWKVKNNNIENKSQILVSIIVPNYNHEPYLRERLESIYNQTYKNYEVILLDDCSSDNSVSILKEYQEKYSNCTKLYLNEKGSGSGFKQWQKGISLAQGDLIWIAESDDYCEKNFLEKMINFFNDESVMLAFSRSVFVQDNEVINTTDDYLRDIEGLDWKESFCITGNEIVKKGFAIKNIIPNVSSAVFRNIKSFSPDVIELWRDLKLCGDWVFYLSLLKGGILAYTCETTNYYRVHKKSTSLKIQKEPRYYREQQEVSKYVVKNYLIDTEIFKKQRECLYNHYKYFHPDKDKYDVDNWYDLNIIEKEKVKRKHNIIMCGFSMIMGGGELYPIVLANALKKKGVPITYFDFNMSGYNPIVRNMLRKDIPLVNVQNLEDISEAIYQLGAEIIHSQHGSVDNMISEILQMNKFEFPKQVITLHGMYEAIRKEDLNNLLNNVSKTCKQFVYIADKNLTAFSGRKDIDISKFIYIGNGLAKTDINPIDRKTLGISKDAFVFAIASRGIPEKGWKEAIEAVKYARLKSNIDIHLIIMGKGEMYDKLINEKFDFIHLLGEKTNANVRDYFACSDMGLMPSRFKGESYPLVVIDCLFAGKPVLASNIGEVKKQLSVDKENLAGALFELDNWKIPIEKLGDIMIEFAKKGERYNNALKNVSVVSKRFDIDEIANKYLSIYNDVCNK